MDKLIQLIFQSPKSMFYTVLIVVFVIIPAIRALKNFSITSRTLSSGGLSVEGLYIPPLEFYKALKNRLNVRGVDIVKSLEHLPEGSLYSNQRQYMRVEKNGVIFYICSFRIGSSQVFTYWEIAPLAIFQRILSNIPLFGGILKEIFLPDTLYKRDVASAIKGMILEDFKKIVSEQENSKGIRELAQADLSHLRAVL